MKKNIGKSLALYPTPLVVVGTMVNGKPNYVLAGHVGIIGHDRIMVSLAKPHYTNQGIKETRALTVNIVDEAMLKKADRTGCVSGNKVDKSDMFAYHTEGTGAPVVNEAPVVMDCIVDDIYETEGFESFICKIDGVYAEENVLNDAGKIGLSNHSLAEIKEAADILAKEDLKISAIQNHYSLLNRSSETSGILDYCKENDIIFFSYMVLEQGALTGKYDTEHLFPEDSDRGRTYNPMLPQLEKLNAGLAEIADRHHVAAAQIPIAWAIAKGTLPIIGVTKVYQVEDAVKTAEVELSAEEIETIEKLGDKAQLNVIRYWEKEMK